MTPFDVGSCRGDRDPRLWNIANDYVINADLIDANIGEQIKLVDIASFDWKHRGMASEEIYDDRLNKQKKRVYVINVEPLDIHLDRTEGDDEGPAPSNKGKQRQ